MSVLTTRDTAAGWSPDVVSHQAPDVVPQAIILRCSTIAGSVSGDEQYARVCYVRDDGESGDGAQVTLEGTEIPDAPPDLDELTVKTRAVTRLATLSQDQFGQPETAASLAESFSRDIVRKADNLFISASDAPLIGLRNVTGLTEADGPIGTDLGALTRLLGQLEKLGSNPTALLIDPESWAQIRDLRTATGHNQPLIGTATDGAADRLLGLEVIRSPFIETGQAIVVDKREIVSAISPVEIASSDQFAFNRRGVTVRGWWRIGWGCPRPERLGRIAVTLPKSK